MPMTRRYETAWLRPSGDVATSTHLGPAISLFESAFSALARGALVQTETGPIAVEDLIPGMRVTTAEGRTEPILWIGSMMAYPAQMPSDTVSATLTRITADALGHGKPQSDLILGGGARLLSRDTGCQMPARQGKAYVPARAFVDGCNVFEIRPGAPVMTYHLALARQGTLRVMGVELESYHPGVHIAQTVEPRLLSLFTALFPHLDDLEGFGPVAYPQRPLCGTEAF
ncbi:Hint domain-containing protein [Phaeovulum sp.]|uniref:Hint domain-containing protein n=1 Tax=Phaeovulum sp. TaxID=2934796 RepID=UPI0039E4A2EA